jgi:hypothetical protein
MRLYIVVDIHARQQTVNYLWALRVQAKEISLRAENRLRRPFFFLAANRPFTLPFHSRSLNRRASLPIPGWPTR